ncbi:Beta-sarcoglycan [Microtus ochrogaster]|uniref:Beta-sarcoglycan n=1 Tax=Microtus ochrogaster TaxID=79684 RepID=A0A8J6H056_MICOH|nr:Beta-sarcoglycan [Microtus ochrogaster]
MQRNESYQGKKCRVRCDYRVRDKLSIVITLVIWAVIRIGPNGCDSMEFHESGLLRFKQVSDMGVIRPLYKSTVGGRRNENLVITGNNQPIVFQQGTTKLSVEKNKTSITSDIGMQFFDPRTQNVLFSTDYENHEFQLPSGVKSLNVQKASTERITSNATSDLNIKVDGRAIVRGNEGVFIMGKTIEFHMGGNVELKAENSIILNGSVMVSPTRMPSSSSGDASGSGDWVRYKLCMCAEGTLFKVQVTGHNMGCQVADNPCAPTLTWKLCRGAKQDQVLLVHSQATLLTLAARRRCLLICSFLLFELTTRRGRAAAASREADARRKRTNIYIRQFRDLWCQFLNDFIKELLLQHNTESKSQRPVLCGRSGVRNLRFSSFDSLIFYAFRETSPEWTKARARR